MTAHPFRADDMSCWCGLPKNNRVHVPGGSGRIQRRDGEGDAACIDRAILEAAGRGVRFSANDLRDRLPAVQLSLVGPRFALAKRRGLIVEVGHEPSTDPGTHGKPVAIYRAAGAAKHLVRQGQLDSAGSI